ncbi:MAG: DUF1073 domain-containing protein [Pseudomonadota bacterium]
MAKPHFRRTADGATVLMHDGIQNAMTRLGTTYDKGAQNRHHFAEMGDSEISAAYHSSWLARQIVEVPVDDATRKWREWSGADSDEVIEAERQFAVQYKVHDAFRRARLFGGAGILIGAGPDDLLEPLDVEQIGKDDLRYLTVLDREDLTSGEIELDPTEALFGKPQYYRMRTNRGDNLEVHPSRLAIFQGHKRSRRGERGLTRYSIGWDMSVLQAVIEAVRGHDASMASLLALLSDAKTDVMKIPDLAKKVIDPNYEDMLVKRMEVAQMLRSIHRREALDAEEDLQSTTYAFSGMGEVIDRFMQVASAAADIPMTRLFGMSPKGLNTTGEGDLANYYDNVESRQRNELGPAIWALDEVMIRSALGDRPDDLKYDWRPLRNMTEKEEAEIANRNADSLAKLVGLDIFDIGELVPAVSDQFASLGITAKVEETIS